MTIEHERGPLEATLGRHSRALSLAAGMASHVFAAEQRLHPTQLQALMHICEAEQEGAPLSAGDLGRLLHLTSGAITYLVERMASLGHVTRQVDERDGRKVRLRSTLSGAQIAQQFERRLASLTAAQMADVSASDLAAAQRVLDALVAALRYSAGGAGAPRGTAALS